jgi:hypothetical protein
VPLIAAINSPSLKSYIVRDVFAEVVGTRAAMRRLANSPSLNSTLTTPGCES